MRSTKFYPTKLVSSFVLLLLFMNVFSAFAQDPGPNISKPTTCIDHNPGTVGSIYTYTYTGGGLNPIWTVKGDIQLLNAAGNVVDTLVGTNARIRSTAGYGKVRLTLLSTNHRAPGSRNTWTCTRCFRCLTSGPRVTM